MKRKGIEKGEKRSSKDLVMIVIAAMVVMTAFVPTAAAGTIDTFEITPAAVSPSTISGYNITVNTSGFGNEFVINLTLPKGFSAVTPTQAALLATVDIYEKNTVGLFANVSFTANATNPGTQVDVVATADSDTISTTKDVNYGPGVANKTTITAAAGGTSLNVEVILPTADVNGSVNASITLPDGNNLTNVSISIREFVKNPADAGNYVFEAKVNEVVVSDTVTVTSAGVTSEIALVSAWNMVSLPALPDDATISGVFGSNVTTVFGWTGTGYEQITGAETLEPKKGYWAFSSSAYNASITGTSVATSVSLSSGWNMVGPVSSGVTVDSLTGVTTVFGWTGTGYEQITGSDTLEMGKGYWMFAGSSTTVQV